MMRLPHVQRGAAVSRRPRDALCKTNRTQSLADVFFANG